MKKLNKKIILLSIFAVVLLSSVQTIFAQQFTPEQRQYQKIIAANGISQKKLFDITNRWIISNKMVDTVYEDTENCVIVGTGFLTFGLWYLTYETPGKYPHTFSVVIEVKDEIVRFTFSKIYVTTTGKLAKANYKEDYVDLQPEVAALSSHLHELTSQKTYDLFIKYIQEEFLTDFEAIIEKEQDTW